MPWHLEYQDESGNWVKIDENTLMPNRWVKFAKVSGEGGTEAERIGVTIYSQRESADPNPDHWSQQNEDLMKLAPLSCAPSGAGDTIFFPWSKMRGNNGRYGGSTGSANIYWIASPKYTAQDYENYGYVFSFSYSGIVHATAHGSGPSAGYNQAVSVRPVRETD